MMDKVVLVFESVGWGTCSTVTIQMKATDKYFPLVLFMTLFKVDEILKCDHSNESY